MILQVAHRKRAKIKMQLAGPAGSGKSYSSLLVAYGLCMDWTKIAVIDTENHSAELYAHLGEYNVLNLSTGLTVGDSHEYESTFSPFDETYINDLITSYLKKFAIVGNWKLVQLWHGIYPKMTDGKTDVFIQAEEGVYILNGLGGAGMTLSFGLAEEVIATIS